MYPRWNALLLYQPGLLGFARNSLVDDSSFFLSDKGAFDAFRELQANLEQFYADRKDYQCRFPARYRFICEMANQSCDESFRHCSGISNWLAEYREAKFTLVFASAFLENPASMFGHTFLRLDKPGRIAPAPLLEKTVNFAARTNQERGPLFAIKGLSGFFQGRFALREYSHHVRAYSDIDSRDLWEYELALSEEERLWILLHLWELKDIYVDYYFIDENCSYYLLALLDTARPELRLKEEFIWYAVPVDTLRAIREREGLVTKVSVRPARVENIRVRERALKQRSRVLAESLVEDDRSLIEADEFQALELSEQAAVLELAQEYARYKHGKLAKDTPTPNELSDFLLQARSDLPIVNQFPKAVSPKVDPTQAHKGRRAAFGIGFDSEELFLESEFRFLYHGAQDPQPGFMRGASLEAFKLGLRYFPESGSTSVERIELLNVQSSPAWGAYIRPYSWSAKVGAYRRHFSKEESELMPSLGFGAGLSLAPSPQVHFGVLSGARAHTSSRFSDGFELSPSVALFGSYRPASSFQFRVESEYGFMLLSEKAAFYKLEAQQSLTLSSNLAVLLRSRHQREFSHSHNEHVLSVLLYF